MAQHDAEEEHDVNNSEVESCGADAGSDVGDLQDWDDESEDTLPRSTLNAPIEALQGLANAAAEAAAAPSASPPR